MSNGSNQHLSCSSFKNYSSGILSLPHPSIHTDKLKIIDNDQSPAKCSGSPLYLGVIPITWKVCSSLSRVWLFATPWTVAHQAPLSMEFSRQEYWSGWPFPSPGDLPDSGIELRAPTLRAVSLTSELPRKPCFHLVPLFHLLVDTLNSQFHLPTSLELRAVLIFNKWAKEYT